MAKVGSTSDIKKLPSILNYTVKQNCVSVSPDKTNEKQVNAAEIVGDKYRGIGERVHDDVTSKLDKEKPNEILTSEVNTYSETENLNISINTSESEEGSPAEVMIPDQTNMKAKLTSSNHSDLLHDLVRFVITFVILLFNRLQKFFLWLFNLYQCLGMYRRK